MGRSNFVSTWTLIPERRLMSMRTTPVSVPDVTGAT